MGLGAKRKTGLVIWGSARTLICARTLAASGPRWQDRAMRPIESLDDIAEGLDALARQDRRLRPVIARAGAVPLRRSPPGFASLASIIVAQQVSKASADAIFGRLAGLLDPLTPDAVLQADEDVFRAAGLSRPKQATLLAIAAAEKEGLGLDDLCALPAGEAA